MRKIVIDTETTGLSSSSGHRIIEIGAVEIINRRLSGNTFHFYLQPDRLIDKGAMLVHGITDEFLKDKPRFHEVAHQLLDFIKESELIIHNAPFDLGFLDAEFSRMQTSDWKNYIENASVIDTLIMARRRHPGKQNNLDALCKRYNVNNQHRAKHGALLDAEILAQVYLTMTGGQETLVLEEQRNNEQIQTKELNINHMDLPRIKVSDEEQALHQQFLKDTNIQQMLNEPI